jgi:hypothetical protein
MSEANFLSNLLAWRFHVKPEHSDKIAVLDEAITEVQLLADLYVRYLERELDSQTATKPDDVTLVANLHQALSRSGLALARGAATIGGSLLGLDDVLERDF